MTTTLTPTDRVEQVIRRYLLEIGADREVHNARPLAEAIVKAALPATAPELKGRYEGWSERRVELADGDGTGDGFGSDWGESDDEGIELLRDIAAHLWQVTR